MVGGFCVPARSCASAVLVVSCAARLQCVEIIILYRVVKSSD